MTLAGGLLLERHTQQTDCEFHLDVHIRKKRPKALFQAFGKSIYEVEWINRDGPPIVLLKIDGAKANREASFYVNLSCHSHIVRTYGLVKSNLGSVMLLQEMAPEGDLSELLRENEFKPTEQVLCTIFEQICDAMMFLADNRVVHGDLACRNVLVFQSNANEPRKNLVKLTDFGLTRASSLYAVLDSAAHTTMTIIPTRYAAPELLQNTDKLPYSEKSDVYSMGTLMWEACSYGQLPYANIHSDNDVRRRKLNDERLSQPPLCNEQLWVVINQCWSCDPTDRPNFRQLKDYLLCLSRELAKQYSSTETIRCIYCQNICTRNDYETHKRNCLHNRSNSSNRHPDLRNNQSTKKSTTLRNTAQFPCEFCNKLFSENELLTHQIGCLRNPIIENSRASSHQQDSIINIYNNDIDDDTIPLFLNENNQRTNNNAIVIKSPLFIRSLDPTKNRKRKKLKIPCCCC